MRLGRLPPRERLGDLLTALGLVAFCVTWPDNAVAAGWSALLLGLGLVVLNDNPKR